MGWLSRIWRRPPYGGAGAPGARADEPEPGKEADDAPESAVSSNSTAPAPTLPNAETVLDEVGPAPEIAAQREKAGGGREPVADSRGRTDEDLDVEAAIAMDAVGELPEDWDLIRELAPGQELASFLADELDAPWDLMASGLVDRDVLEEEERRWWDEDEEDDIWGRSWEEEEAENEEEDWEEEGDDELMW